MFDILALTSIISDNRLFLVVNTLHYMNDTEKSVNNF